jgi:hypothetical protein
MMVVKWLSEQKAIAFPIIMFFALPLVCSYSVMEKTQQPYLVLDY